ncbi:MAG: hypothetical protein MZV63_10755 [Marinilabiliales bacterium]|nr:hypothetical protein [Marinilabiliales bacterium]
MLIVITLPGKLLTGSRRINITNVGDRQRVVKALIGDLQNEITVVVCHHAPPAMPYTYGSKSKRLRCLGINQPSPVKTCMYGQSIGHRLLSVAYDVTIQYDMFFNDRVPDIRVARHRDREAP